MIVDEKTNLKLKSFHATKGEIANYAFVLFSKWKKQGITTDFIRHDNAGENKTLEKKANGEKWQLNIQLEHDPRSTLK